MPLFGGLISNAFKAGGGIDVAGNQAIGQALESATPGEAISKLAQIGTPDALKLAASFTSGQPAFNPLTPKDAAMYGAQMYSANPLANNPPDLAALSRGIMPGQGAQQNQGIQTQQPTTQQTTQPQVDPRTLSGDDFLQYAQQKFGPGFANEVKAIADGKQQPPTPGSRGALAGLLTQAVMQYKPDFDAAAAQTNYKNRAATTTEFTKGEAAKSARSIGTASNHLAHLVDQIDDTASHKIPLIGNTVNAVENAVSGNSGNQGITNFNQSADALAGELGAVYKGSGHNSDTEIKTMRNGLSSSGSAEQKYGAMENALKLMRGRAAELAQQYNSGMAVQEGDDGYKTPDDFLSPDAKANIAKAQAKIEAFKTGNKSAASAILPPQVQGATASKTIGGKTYHLVNGQWMQ